MKRYLYIILCAALLTSCAKDVLIDQGTLSDGESINATFTLAPDFVEEIEVRSVAGVDEKVIKDLWVIQLDAGGTIQLQAPKYIETGLTASASDCKVSVSLKREASKIYFIANTHNAALYTTAMKTSADVEAVAMTLTGEANLASANGIPMSGVWTGTPDLLGIAGRVSLSRAVAKVSFNLNASLPAGEVFTLKSVAVKQVPDKLNYYRDAAKLDVYPYPATPNIITDYSTAAYNEKLNTTSKSVWWYLPENARGMGTATIQTDKGSKLPAGQAAYCTYLEVAGRYEAGGGTYNATYKIYLGANNTNDYNVKRNTVYNVNTTIKGIDAADTRINTVDKSIIIGQFGGWDETKKEYTKLLEVQSVETDKDLSFQWSTNLTTFTDVTKYHYGLSNTTNLRGISPDLSDFPAVKYCADLGNGWYLPSQNQLMAIWIANNAIPIDFRFHTINFWSSTEKNESTGVYFSPLDGGFGGDNKTFHKRVRCVRDVKSTVALSPMVVTNGEYVIIDSRSMPSGAITATQKPMTTEGNETTLGPNNATNLSSAVNNERVYQYFAVSKDENSVSTKWESAFTVCQNYNSGDGAGKWRLPTQREIMLIWTLKDRLVNAGIAQFAESGCWSATEYDNKNCWNISFVSGSTYTITKSVTSRVRCVRDLIPNEVTVNHLEWATGNLVADGKGGCKIGAPTDGGLYFQFGSLIGWSGSNSNDGTGMGSSNTLSVQVKPQGFTGSEVWTDTGKIWTDASGIVPQPASGTTVANGVGDPCHYYLGGTWRLPTQAECNVLLGQTPTFSSELSWDAATAVGWEKKGGFTVTNYGVATHTKTGMQILASGYRDISSGSLVDVGSYGFFRSSTPSNTNSYFPRFNSTVVYPGYIGSRISGIPIRCVRNVR